MQLNTIDLNKLQVFLAVARHGSVRGAAAQLHRTPSAVSQSLAAFQGQLRRRLVRKIGTRLYLTAEGRRLSRALEENQAQLARLLAGSARPDAPVTGLARLGLYTGCPPQSVGASLESALREQAGIRLRISYGTHRELAEALSRNQIDIALSVQPLRELSRNVQSRKLFEEELVVVSRTPFRLPAQPEAWSKIAVIEYFESAPLFPLWHAQQYGARKIHANARAYAATLEQVLDLVRRGLGCAVVPRTVAAESGLKLVQGQSALRGATWLNFARSDYLAPAAQILKEKLEKRGPV